MRDCEDSVIVTNISNLLTAVGNIKTQLNALKTDLNTLETAHRTQINNLRTDFQRHDHGATYAELTTRISTAANSLSEGTLNATPVTSPTYTFVVVANSVPSFLWPDSRI